MKSQLMLIQQTSTAKCQRRVEIHGGRKERKEDNRTNGQTMDGKKGEKSGKNYWFMDVKLVYLNVVSAHTLSYTVTWFL